MRFITSFAAIFFAFMVATAVACPSQLRVAGDRIFVPIEINGVKTEALLDSGAEMTLIDAGFARRISLVTAGSEIARGTGGTEEVRFAQSVDIEAAGAKLYGITVAVLDLSDISERLVGEPVNAVVGRELFDSGRFFLDINHGKFCITEDLAEPQGVRLTLREHKGIMQVPVTIESLESVYADFDLGNGSEVLIGRSYALQNQWLDSDRIVGTKMGGGIGGAVSQELIELETLTIAGVSIPAVIAAIDSTEDAPAANIGVAILRNFVMIIDFSDKAVWFTAIESTK